jgi:ribokinase
LRTNLQDAGVDITLLQTGVGEISGSSLAMVNEFGDFAAIIISGANADFDAESVDISADTGLLLLQNELPEDANLVLARKAVGRGIDIVLNGCPYRETSDELLALTGTLILGAREAEAIRGQPFATTRNALEAVESLSEQVPRVAIFLGGGGMVHGERGKRPEYHPARERKPISMHGALDFFVGAYASQVADGSEFEAAMHYAQAAATLFMTTPVERRDLIRATQIRARLGEDDR